MNKKKRYYFFIKRLADIIVSLLGSAVFLIPVFLSCGIIFVQSPGSALFRQLRMGKNGKPFYINKIRTMRQDAPQVGAVDMENEYTKWVLPFGAFLREISLDEIPQLINILKGEMSLVGPRPLMMKEVEMHRGRLEHNVYSLRPGLTGLAQVNGGNRISMEKKLELDIAYTENCSLWLDIKIILKTVGQIFRKDSDSKNAE